jgi:hypothetical protein
LITMELRTWHSWGLLIRGILMHSRLTEEA